MRRIHVIGIGAGDPDYVTAQAVRALNDVKARCFGAVLNDINLEKSKYGDYYYAYRQYGYYYGEKKEGASS